MLKTLQEYHVLIYIVATRLFLIRNDVHEMRLIETIAVILPYAGYCQNDTCYKKEVMSAVKEKNIVVVKK